MCSNTCWFQWLWLPDSTFAPSRRNQPTYYYSFLQCLIIPASEIGGPCSYFGKTPKTFLGIHYNTSSSLSEILCVNRHAIYAVVTHKFMNTHIWVSFPCFLICMQIQAWSLWILNVKVSFNTMPSESSESFTRLSFFHQSSEWT